MRKHRLAVVAAVATAAAACSGATTVADAAPVATPGCTVQDTTVALDPGHPGADSHFGFALQVTNHGTATCFVRGYPRVAQLDGAGRVVERPVATPRGYRGGLPAGETSAPTVRLTPGQTATALLEGVVTQADGTSCGASTTALRISLPGRSASTTLAAFTSRCSGNQIHPFLAGTTGTTGGAR